MARAVAVVAKVLDREEEEREDAADERAERKPRCGHPRAQAESRCLPLAYHHQSVYRQHRESLNAALKDNPVRCTHTGTPVRVD